MLNDEERGYRAGRRAGARFARNPQRDPQDPKIPSAVADSVVYLRYWREGWVEGMTDPSGTGVRKNPWPRTGTPGADAPHRGSSPTGDPVLGGGQ